MVALLVEVRRRAKERVGDEAAFDAVQNAEVAAGAEEYYRAMVRGDRSSWNVRDHHMADTVDRLTGHLGSTSKGLVWEHNTHVGDARATDMAGEGMVNVGQLLRERHHDEGVPLVGFAGHRGQVLAGAGWGAPEQVMTVPAARAGSHEDLLHEALGEPSVLVFGEDRAADGSPAGLATGRSASSTTRAASGATTSRPAWADATTHSCGSRTRTPSGLCAMRVVPWNRSTRRSRPASEERYIS